MATDRGLAARGARSLLPLLPLLVVAAASGCAGPLYRACDRQRVEVDAPVFVTEQELVDVLAVGRIESGIAATDGAPFVAVALTNQVVESVHLVADCRWYGESGDDVGDSLRWSCTLLPAATVTLRFQAPGPSARTHRIVFAWDR